MKQSKIQEWLTYWQNARMVDLDEIRAFEHVHQARRFCSCMRVGVFAAVADLDIWRALENMRDGAKYPELNMTQAEQSAIRSLAT
jgi:hypothetical protein